MRAKMTWFSFIAHIFLPVVVKYSTYYSWHPFHYTESRPCSCCLDFWFWSYLLKESKEEFSVSGAQIQTSAVSPSVGVIACPRILASHPKIWFEGRDKSVFMALNPSAAHTDIYCWTARDPLFFGHWKNGEDCKLKPEGHTGWEISLGTHWNKSIAQNILQWSRCLSSNLASFFLC